MTPPSRRPPCARPRRSAACRACRLLDGAPVDLHHHGLGEAFGRCREHLDVAFAAVAPATGSPQVSDESLDVRWWPVDALPSGVVPDLAERLPRVVAATRLLPGRARAARP
ncbi:hypothetical protein GCM10025868_37550 [Angustibacter aerolatus]|uniref:Nudix hydrolase domain-containing protein n=1 Tax=Angustibacter aerolatus TaxID=1162965 RepID=A0ABQ6JMN1_9ACTN|nr:hypothetical protein [Angustibacter aerolatus]GMA88505.1 hypothetical protein GCM10025868_37550 [Angustibacter aerolatus]